MTYTLCTAQTKESREYHASPIKFLKASLNAHTYSALASAQKNCWWICELAQPLPRAI